GRRRPEGGQAHLPGRRTSKYAFPLDGRKRSVLEPELVEQPEVRVVVLDRKGGAIHEADEERRHVVGEVPGDVVPGRRSHGQLDPFRGHAGGALRRVDLDTRGRDRHDPGGRAPRNQRQGETAEGASPGRGAVPPPRHDASTAG